jgi:hypothetical protein
MRLEKARESLRAAISALTLELLNSCASRCYLAMFQAAVVALEAPAFIEIPGVMRPFRPRSPMS